MKKNKTLERGTKIGASILIGLGGLISGIAFSYALSIIGN